MFVIVITGGVACGKSTVSRVVLDRVSSIKPRYFSCDVCVGELLTEAETLAKLADVAGDQVINADGGLNREWFRSLLFSDPSLRKKVEDLLHPQVLARANDFIRESEKKSDLIFIEVPLLYEVDFPIDRDLVIVVAASERTQLQRLTEKRNIDQQTAIGILNAQIPVQEKIDQSDWVVWNDGSRKALDIQIDLIAGQLKRKFD